MATGIDVWTVLFVVSLAQGIFLLGLLLCARKSNKAATIVLMAILLGLMVTNLDYFLIASGLFHSVPRLLEFPME